MDYNAFGPEETQLSRSKGKTKSKRSSKLTFQEQMARAKRKAKHDPDQRNAAQHRAPGTGKLTTRPLADLNGARKTGRGLTPSW